MNRTYDCLGNMRRYPLIVAASILLLAGFAWSMAVMHIDRAPTDAAGAANMQALLPLWGVFAGLWAVLTLLWFKVRNASPESRWNRADVLLIVSVAIGIRLVVVLAHNPALSDDVHRYTFDGRNLAAGVNPYLVLPEHRIDAAQPQWAGEREVAALINNPQLHTVYLPVSQYVFGAAATLIADAWSTPMDAARVFRGVFSVIDIAVVVMLLLALRRAGRSPWWVVLYAWHPLVVSEIAGSGHQDVIGIALMVAALLVAQRGASVRLRVGWWAAPLTLAILVKPIAAFVGLFVARRCSFKALLAAGLLGVIVIGVIGTPLLLSHDAQPLQNMRETAEQFTTKWSHFSSVYEPILTVLEAIDPIEDRDVQWEKKERHESIARWLALTILLLVVVVVVVRDMELWTAARIVLLVMVLLSPTAHPWYLLWALALMPMSPSPALWILSLTLPWGYAVLGDTIDWSVPGWVYVAAYVPVYAALSVELWCAVRCRSRAEHSAMQSSETKGTIAQ